MEIDWSVLRRPIALFATCVLVSAAVATGAYFYGSEVQREYRDESRRLSSARSKYLTLDDEKRLIQEFYPQYEELEKQGRIGEEQRLNWIETLRQIAARIKLPSLNYEIGAQREYTPDFPVDSGRFAVFASDMTLNAGLLHEEDLPRLFADLQRNAAGAFSVSECKVRRTERQFQTDPTKANLDAQCRLRWMVVKLTEKKSKKGRRRTRRPA